MISVGLVAADFARQLNGYLLSLFNRRFRRLGKAF